MAICVLERERCCIHEVAAINGGDRLERRGGTNGCPQKPRAVINVDRILDGVLKTLAQKSHAIGINIDG